jgi:hypothetical protein
MATPIGTEAARSGHIAQKTVRRRLGSGRSFTMSQRQPNSRITIARVATAYSVR